MWSWPLVERSTIIMFRPFLVVLMISAMVLAACGGGGGGGQGGGTGGAGAGNADNGRRLFAQNTIGRNNAPGCASCHSVEPGKTMVGPTMAGIATKAQQTLNSGNYQGDETDVRGYLREAIVEPNAHVDPGFSPGIMYQNYGRDLTEQEINDLVAYMETLR
jgi:cytochrome c2